MTVAAVATETTYAIGGLSGLGPYPTVFPYATDADVNVWLDLNNGGGPQQISSGQYTLADVIPTLPNGGNVTLSNTLLAGAPTWPTGALLVLTRGTSLSQPTSFQSGPALAGPNIEAALDNVERQVQELRQALLHTLITPLGEGQLVLPDAQQRANLLFGFSALGGIQLTPAIAAVSSFNTVEQFGAKGDGVTDDTAAITQALANSSLLLFKPGSTYKFSAPMNVPVSCRTIYGTGAIMNGPGIGSGVDCFIYQNWYIGGGTINMVSSQHYMPDVQNCRRAFSLIDSSWVNLQFQYVQNCVSAVYCNAPGSGLSSYCVQNQVTAQTIQLCTAAFDIGASLTTGIALQGNTFNLLYSVGNNFAVRGTWGASQPLFDQNFFNIGIIDANGATGTCWGVKHDFPSGGGNVYNIPGGLVPNANFATQPFVNLAQPGALNTTLIVGDYRGNGSAPLAWANWDSAGPKTTANPAFGDLIIHIATTGSDTTGDGSAANPYATMNHAIAQVQNIDFMGTGVTIQLANGTYTAGFSYNTGVGNTLRGSVNLQGNTASPSSVIINVASGVCVSAQGAGAEVEVTGMTLEGQNGVLSIGGATVVIGPDVVFGAMTGAHIQALQFGLVEIISNYTISGGAAAHLDAIELGIIAYIGTIVATVTGTPAITDFALSNQNGLILATNVTYPGTGVTGTKYSATLGGGINTGGGGAGYFPGGTAGAVTAPGWYA